MRWGGLVIGGRIDRYVGGLFLASYATSFLLLVGLALILNLASNLDWFEPWKDGTPAPTLTIVRFYLLNVPFLYLQVAPFVTVIAGLFTVSRLIKHNELVAGLSAGVPAQRLLAPVFVGAALAAVGMFWLREAATGTIGLKRDMLLHVLEERTLDRVFEDVWFRDVYGNVVKLGEFRPATGDPPEARIEDVEATLTVGGLTVLVRADSARWEQFPDGPDWHLENGIREEIETSKRQAVDRLAGISFSPRDVLVAIKGSERALELSFSEVTDLASRDPDNSEYRTLLQYHLTFPLANLVLLLVALPFMVGQERGKGLEGLVAGCLLCVFYFAVDFVARSMGMEGTLPPLVASWLPVLLFGSLGIVLFDSMRS